MARATKKEQKKPAGIPGDRFRVQLKGRRYYIVDSLTSMVMGGPFTDRGLAQEKSDAMERNLGVR